MCLIPNSITETSVRFNMGAYGGNPYRTSNENSSVWYQAIYSYTVLNRYKDLLLTKRKNIHFKP